MRKLLYINPSHSVVIAAVGGRSKTVPSFHHHSRPETLQEQIAQGFVVEVAPEDAHKVGGPVGPLAPFRCPEYDNTPDPEACVPADELGDGSSNDGGEQGTEEDAVDPETLMLGDGPLQNDADPEEIAEASVTKLKASLAPDKPVNANPAKGSRKAMKKRLRDTFKRK